MPDAYGDRSYVFVRLRRQRRGYHFRYEIVDYPNGMPRGIGVMLSGA